MISGSIEIEITHRLGKLYENHHDWLRSVAYNLCKSHEITDDLVQELYLYLGEKKNPKLFFADSFNLKYCHAFLSSRFINLVKRENKNVYPNQWRDKEDTPYDSDWDLMVDKFEKDVKDELDRLKTTKMWPSARLYEMYMFSDMTMEQVSKEIGISESTTYLRVKEIKNHLKNTLKNPNDESKS